MANRYLSYPSGRSRVLAAQMFAHDIEGFLHWGFNFYNSQFSLRTINPFVTTDADQAFVGGDPFLVYPDIDGTPLESIRLMVLDEMMHDLRAYDLLASLTSREHVITLIEAEVGPPAFDRVPAEGARFVRLSGDDSSGDRPAVSCRSAQRPGDTCWWRFEHANEVDVATEAGKLGYAF